MTDSKQRIIENLCYTELVYESVKFHKVVYENLLY